MVSLLTFRRMVFLVFDDVSLHVLLCQQRGRRKTDDEAKEGITSFLLYPLYR